MKICHPISEKQLRKISAVKSQLGIMVEMAASTGSHVKDVTLDINDLISVLANMELQLSKVIRQVEAQPFLP